MKKIILSIIPIALILGLVGGLYFYSASKVSSPIKTDFVPLSGSPILQVVQGGTGATTLTGCLTGNGTGPITGTGSACGSGGGGTFPFTTQAGYNSTSTVIGFLNGLFSNSTTTLNNSVYFPTISQGFAGIGSNGKIYTFATSSINTNQLTNGANFITLGSLSGTFPIAYNNGTGAITFTGLGTSSSAVIGNIPYFSGPNTFANIATTSATCTGTVSCTGFTVLGASPITINGAGGAGFAFPFTPTTNYNVNTNATSTPVWFRGSPYSMMASSTALFDTIFVASTTATSTIANFGGERDASAYTGSDICAKANNVYNTVKDTNVNIVLPAGTHSCSNVFTMNTDNRHVWLHGKGSAVTKIVYTGQATSTIDTGQEGFGSRISDFTYMGTSTTDTAPGFAFGGTNGFAYSQIDHMVFQNLGKAVTYQDNVYATNMSHSVVNFNVKGVAMEYSNNSGENLSFSDVLFADNRNPTGSLYNRCIDFNPDPNIGVASVFLGGHISLDKCQIYIGPEVNIFFNQTHVEILGNSSGAYYPIYIAGDANTSVHIDQIRFTNGNDAAHSPVSWIYKTDGDLIVNQVVANSYGGYTLPYLVTNTGSGQRQYSGLSNLSNTGFSAIELNSDTGLNMAVFNQGRLLLGTTTSSDDNTPLQVFGPTWDGSDYYQAFIGDNLYRGLSMGYDSTNNWATIHPVNPGITSLDLFLGSPYALTNGIFLKATNGYTGIGTTSPFARLSVNPVAGDSVGFLVGSSTATQLSVSSLGFGTTTLSGLNISGSATSTSNVGFNITAGCYAVRGVCISGGAGGGITSLTLGTGLVQNGTTISSTGTIQGAVATSATPTIGNIAMWTGTGVSGASVTVGSVATGTISCAGNCSVGTGSYVIGGNLTITSPFSFTSFPSYNATGTAIGFQSGLFSTASSTFNNNLFLSNLSGGFLYTGSNGIVKSVATSSISLSGFNNDLAALTATNASLTFSGSYNGSVARTVGLNLGNANTWTALQTFSNSSTSLASFGYASSTLYYGAGLSSCNGASNAITWNAGIWGCNTIAGGSGITTLGSGYASTSLTVVTFSTTTSSTNGLTSAISIVPGASTLTFTPSISGTLTTAGGGTGISNPGGLAAGAILNFNGSGGATAVSAPASGIALVSNGSNWISNIPVGVIGGGTGSTTAPAGQLIYGGVDSYQSVATTTLVAGTNVSFSGGTPIIVGKTPVTINASGGSASAGGSDTQVQFNDGTALGGAVGFIWDKVKGVLGIGTTTPTYNSVVTIASSTAPQLSLFDGAGISGWAFRNKNGNLYFSTTTVSGLATSTGSALALKSSGNIQLSGNIEDANGNTILGFNPTANAVNYLKLGNSTGSDLTIDVGGTDDNVGWLLRPKGFASVGIQTLSNGINAFKVVNDVGAVAINADTANLRFGVATDTPSSALSVYQSASSFPAMMVTLVSNAVSFFINEVGKVGINKTNVIHHLDVEGRIAGQPTYDCQIPWLSQTAITTDQLGSATVASFLCEGNMFFDVNGGGQIQALTVANAQMASGTPMLQTYDASASAPQTTSLVFTKGALAGSATSTNGLGIAMSAVFRTQKVGVSTTSVNYVPIGFTDTTEGSVTTPNSYYKPANGVILTASSTANWILVAFKNSVATQVDTGLATSSTAVNKAVLVVDGASARVYINNSATPSATIANTALPTSYLRPIQGVGLGSGTALNQGQMRVGLTQVWFMDKR